MVESPVWLSHKAGSSSAGQTHSEESEIIFHADTDEGEHPATRSRYKDAKTSRRVSGARERLLADQSGLSDEEGGAPHSVSKPPPQTIWGVIKSPLTRKGLRIVVITQIAQQASGINAGEI